MVKCTHAWASVHNWAIQKSWSNPTKKKKKVEVSSIVIQKLTQEYVECEEPVRACNITPNLLGICGQWTSIINLGLHVIGI